MAPVYISVIDYHLHDWKNMTVSIFFLLLGYLLVSLIENDGLASRYRCNNMSTMSTTSFLFTAVGPYQRRTTRVISIRCKCIR